MSRRDVILQQIEYERCRQFYEGVRFFLFEVIPAFAQAAVLIVLAFLFAGCFGG